MQYKEYNDYELLYMVNENDENAYNLLYEKYKPLVVNFAKKYTSVYQNYGIDFNDFLLEGYIGLDVSINKFKEYDDHKFNGLVCTCINRQMQNLVKQWNKMVVGQAGKALTKALAYGGTALLFGTAGKGLLYDWYNDYF